MNRLTTKMMTGVLLAASALLAAAPVEEDVYLTGAWGAGRSDASARLYRQAGFTMAPSGDFRRFPLADYRYIDGVSGQPPREAARPFETADGKLLESVGLFTHVNFSAPSVEAWWRTHVARLMEGKRKHAHRVAFWKVHNEFGYHSGELFDYSEGSIARYREWLRRRYGSIEKLNLGWRTRLASFEVVEPPRRDLLANLPNWLDWRRFTAWNFARYFRETGDLIRRTVPDAKVSDNFYMTSGLDGWDLFELARQTDYLAMDIYAIGRWDSLIGNIDVARSAAHAWRKPFLMMEYHAGPNHWITQVFAWQLYTEALIALGRESRALQWYMWAPGRTGREEGIHGILSPSDQPTERMTAVTHVSEFTRRLAPLLNRAKTRPVVGVVRSNDSQYLQRAHGRNVWQFIEDDMRLGRLLDLAGIPYVLIDAEQLTETDLAPFRALVLSGVPVVSDAALDTIRRFARDGRAVVVHPSAAERDGFGHPRRNRVHPFEPLSQPVAASPHRRHAVRGGLTPVAGLPADQFAFQETDGVRRAFCAWDMYRLPLKDEATLVACADQYAALLREVAGVVPEVTVQATGLGRRDLDARLLHADGLRLLFLTKLSPADAEATVSIPYGGGPRLGWLLAPDRSALVRCEGTVRDGRLHFTLPLTRETALSGGVLLVGQWQPLVDVTTASGQETFRPGERAELLVGVANLGAEPVSGRVALTLPDGWRAEPAQGETFADVQPGARAVVRYRLSVPEGVDEDFFGYRYPVEAHAEFTAGASGRLSARLLPFVKSTLDVRVSYRGELLNPWQELTPPVLRWGWDSEVITPPPTPLAVRGDTAATLLLDAHRALVGRPLALSVVHEDGTPGVVRCAAGVQPVVASELPVVFDLPRPGAYRLTCTVGDVTKTVTVKAAAGEETARRAMETAAASLRPGERLLGVAARRRSAGTVVQVTLDRPLGESASLWRLDGTARRQVPFLAGGESLQLNADVAADGVTLYALSEAPGAQSAPARVTAAELSPGRLQITGDSYRVVLDTQFGWVERLDIREGDAWRPFLTERTGPVIRRTDGRDAGPETSTGVTLLTSAFSPVGGTLEFERPLDDGAVSVRESWQFEPNHIRIDVRMRNSGRTPLRYRALGYDLGANGETAPRWRVLDAEGRTLRAGELPEPATASGGETLVLTSPGGASMAVTRRRCAQNKKWASLPTSVSHSSGRTQLSLVRGMAVDPADFILAEFDWWFSAAGEPAIGDPGATPAVRP